MSRREEAYRRIEDDIRREKASALGRAGERLEDAIAELAELGRRLEATRDADERRRLAHEYESARTRMRAARMALLIQREAIGLRHHAAVDQAFPEPPRPRR